MSLTGTPLDFVFAFLAGVALSFTPCVYPLLPVMAAAVAGENTSGRAWGGFLLSLLYVLGLAVSYSFLAIAAVLTGKVFGVIQNNPWVMLGVANVILIFALSMLDVFHFPHLGSGRSARQEGWWGIFVIGLTSGFMVSPCTAPVLGTLLVHIATRQDVPIGVALLFVFAVGSGTSLVLAGTFSGFLASLPKAGIWMVRIKKASGVVLLILAEYYVIKAGQLFL